MIKVLFAARPKVFEVPGGDTVQLLQMQKHLAALGVQAHISSDPAEIGRSSWDIVHLFNLFDTDTLYPQAQLVAKQGIPSVLTPNYWRPYEFFFATSPSLAHRLFKAILPTAIAMDRYEAHKRQKMQDTLQKQQQILQSCRYILPNSEMERAQLMDEYKLDDAGRFSVVYNAVSPTEIDAASSDEFAAQYAIRDFVLCVGRFEERKNQLGLIQALRRTDIPIVFMGGVPSYQQGYLEECKKAARKINGQVLFIHENQSPSMVYSAMKNARVHVLPSWWENTGLVSLEATLCGCRMVTTDRSPFREYFGDAAYPCNPASQASIRSAVLQAYAADPDAELAETIRGRFTWERVAADMATVYRAL